MIISTGAVQLAKYRDMANVTELECGPISNVMAALPNKGSALCSTPQSLADAQY